VMEVLLLNSEVTLFGGLGDQGGGM